MQNVPDMVVTHSHLYIHMFVGHVFGASQFRNTQQTRVKLAILAQNILLWQMTMKHAQNPYVVI